MQTCLNTAEAVEFRFLMKTMNKVEMKNCLNTAEAVDCE